MATAKKKEEAKEVAVIEEAGAVGALDYGDDAGSGFENQTSADVLIPFLNVLQALSPACQGEDSTARPGMIQDSATGETYSGKRGLLFVPAMTQHLFNEWTPRDAGGGLVGTFLPGDEAVERAMKHSKTRIGKIKSENGTEFVETFNIYGVVADEDRSPVGMAVISCSSTKIKPYRQLMTRLQKFTVLSGGRKILPPLFAHLLRLKTTEEKRPAGVSYNWVFEGAVDNDLAKGLLSPNDPCFLQAKKCKELVLEGKVRTEGGGSSEDGEDNAPF